jgi:acyl-homoserine lactone acylase PvdQ
VPDGENPVPERPVGFDPQETFTKNDKTRNVQNRIGIQIMELNPIREKKSAKKRMRGKR